MDQTPLLRLLLILFPIMGIALIVGLIYRDHVSEWKDKYSTFWPRLWSPSIDQTVVLLIAVFAPKILHTLEIINDALYYNLTIFSVAIYPIYSIISHAKFGATLGKRLCRVVVVDAKTEKKMSIKQAFLRDSIPTAFILCIMLLASSFTPLHPHIIAVGILIIWYILELSTMHGKKQRAIHDLLAGTVVVRSDIWALETERRPARRGERTFK